jgi:SAM-dependent MidA family methyltransferase
VVRDLGFDDTLANESRVPNPESRLVRLIGERGPLTVAAFMELALYDSEFGYYARAAQRSGRAGDFFTSVDVGAVFGELLGVQIVEIAKLLQSTAETAKNAEKNVFSASSAGSAVTAFDFVEAGAGNGRLSADILRALQERDPRLYARTRLHLVDASAVARAAQPGVLGDVADRLTSSSASLPDSFEGVLIANELLDALPVHQVVMREDGLREVFVRLTTDDCRLTTAEGPPSTPALQAYLDRLDVTLEPGWCAEINLRAVDWIRDAARRLTRGFIILIDYGHEARELYSASHAQGTLTTFSRHQSDVDHQTSNVAQGFPGPAKRGTREGGSAAWLQRPGGQDITAHVDFTGVRTAAEDEDLQTLAFLDQTYFVLGLLPALNPQPSALRQAKTLLMPGGLGSTHKVMIFGKNVGTPSLQCCSFGGRVT